MAPGKEKLRTGQTLDSAIPVSELTRYKVLRDQPARIGNQMGKIIRLLLGVSIILIAIASGTCYYGPEYERTVIHPHPAEDFILMGREAVGDRWTMIGGLILCIGVGLGLAAILVWVRHRGRGAGTTVP